MPAVNYSSDGQSDLTLPKVQKQTIKSIEAEIYNSEQLYSSVFRDDEELALYIRRRGVELEPDDLLARELIMQLALEVVEIEKRQKLIEGLHPRLYNHLVKKLPAPKINKDPKD
jgi:hypothetical protein